MNPGQLSEYDLLLSVKAGQERAFKELYRRFAPKLLAFAKKILSDTFAAEEVVQDTFLSVWNYRDRIDPSAAFQSLLFTIAKNNVLNVLRRRQRQLKNSHQYGLSMEISRNSTEENIYLEELHRVTHAVIEQLPPQRKAIFKMSRYEGKSYDEIARSMGISRDTVRLQIIKSLHTIREHVMQYGDFTILFILTETILS